MEKVNKKKKREAVFICGFNNWGKSTIIGNLFGRSRFSYGETYPVSGVNFTTEFTVESQSNDDLGRRWLDRINKRVRRSPDRGQYFFGTLCPSMESHNNFIDLLNDPILQSYHRIHIFLIEYKWEHHAKLLVKNIISEGRQVRNANFIVIDADQGARNANARLARKLAQIRTELNRIF